MSEDTPVEEVVHKPDEVKPVAEVPAPIQQPEEHKDDLRQIIDELSGRVNSLEASISTLLETGSEKDSTPHGRPWTARRLF